MPKTIEKKKRKYPAEINRQFGVVLEDINSKMALVLEGHSVMNKNINDLQDDVEDLKNNVENLQTDMVIVKSKLTSIENQFKQKVDINQFEKLEQRVIRLEKIAAR